MVRTGAWLARLAGHALVAAICLELAARVDDGLSYGAPFWGYYDSDSIRERDADGLPRNIPGARFEKWRINRLGFRGEVVAVDRPHGRRRIACLGTSETFGLFEGEGREWPAQLGRLLRAQRSDVEVLNTAVIGLNRGTRERYVEKYVAPLRPDVLVLYLSVLSDASYRAGAPRLDQVAVVPPSVPYADRLPSSRALPKLKQVVWGGLPATVHDHFRVWSLERQLPRAERATLGGRPPTDALPPEALAAFEAHLRELVGAARASGIAPVLATYPTLGTAGNRGAYHLQFLEERVYHPELSELGMIDAATRLNDVTRRVARDLAVPLADADAAVPKTSQYFADYVHYTDEGARRVAQSVLEAIDRGGLLGSAAARVLPAGDPAGANP